MAGIELIKVNKFYGSVHAVTDVDLTISDQEFVVLVGPSGCGKSTTLRMVAGLEDISSGTISIGGRIVSNLPPRERDIAMVFQNYALYQHMTVYDNLAFGLRNRKVPEDSIKKEIDRAASILGIGPLLTRKPKQLSGGQQQRVALGRCLVRNPAVFLFDEPLSNLDAKLRTQMRTELKELRARVPTTSLYVTHDQVEAMTLGDRIVVMKDGFVQQIGSPLELYRTPANRFVAGFLGSPAMNFMDVQIKRGPGCLMISGLGADIPLPDFLSEALAENADTDAILGIRPEHIVLGDRAGGQAFSLEADLVVSEQLGAQQVVEVRIAKQALMVAGVDPERRIERGRRIKLSIPLDRIHFFKAGENGPRICSARMALRETNEPAEALAYAPEA
jgi:multiple sugar transport system ATP-binding protein